MPPGPLPVTGSGSDGVTRLLCAAEVAEWARLADPGSTLLYCVGPFVPEGATKAKVRALTAAGVVRPHHARIDGVLNHRLTKRADAPTGAAEARAMAPGPDEAAEKIFAALDRCARRGRPAHSIGDLARIAGLATRAQAQHRLIKLEAAGRIATETVTAPNGTAWRIVTIGGRRTAGPPAEQRSA